MFHFFLCITLRIEDDLKQANMRMDVTNRLFVDFILHHLFGGHLLYQSYPNEKKQVIPDGGFWLLIESIITKKNKMVMIWLIFIVL